ncbi:MAG TPA: lysine--tRNA ligase [bacterium]|nr:lysine--tRNA ligase [bacterium]
MWVDLLAEELRKSSPGPHVVNDAKTPSGHVPVAHLRGVLMHDCVARALRDAGAPTTFLYGFDDYDPMDDLPPALPDYARYMGMPFAMIPSPDGRAPSYGHFYAAEFADAFNRLGAHPTIYRTSEMYRSGGFDDGIRRALDRVETIRTVYRDVTHSKRIDDHWWPVQVLCERCGRIGTTNVLAWDGDQVEYVCAPDKVAWAQGCGYRGKRSPFRGGAKLLYRVEWPAKWSALGVTVEGAGKDHMTRGGTHDVAREVSVHVFGRSAPFSFAYEFLLYGGKKMSTSKAVGTTASEILQVLRAELARFLIVRPLPRRQVEFDPGGDTIPNLYDEYDRAAAAFFKETDNPDLARTFYFARVDAPPPHCYRPRFVKVAYLTQMPSVDLPRAVARDKGAPLTDDDRGELAHRVADARRWLATYAPEHYKFEVRDSVPSSAAVLTPTQRRYLLRVADAIETGPRAGSADTSPSSAPVGGRPTAPAETRGRAMTLDDRRPPAGAPPWTGEQLHARLHELKEEIGLSPREAFGAIYQAFLGKDSGPQAGWLLAALDPQFVLNRLREVARDAA